MTIMEAIREIDNLKHNTYSDHEKIAWLSALDGRIYREIMAPCAGGEFCGYDDATDRATVLLVGAPYEELYLRYLEAKIDYHNAEYDRYNNAMRLFQAILDGYRNDFNRACSPGATAIRYF